MIILKFRGKYICLDNFKLGFAAYIATVGVMCFIEWRKKRKKRGPILKSLNNVLTVRGGDVFVRRFLDKRLKKGNLYEVVNPRLTRYILELTKSVDSKEILYIDLELLAYAIRTLNRPRASEVAIGNIVRIINPVRTLFSIVIGSGAGVMVKMVAKTSTITGSIVFILILYTSPYHHYNNNLLSDVKVDNQNIEYVLKQPEVPKILVSTDESPPECKIYEMDGRIVPEKEKDASTSIIVEHKPAGKEYKVNRQTKRLNDLTGTITVEDFDESKDDATYVRRNKEREAMRIRINTKNRDSE